MSAVVEPAPAAGCGRQTSRQVEIYAQGVTGVPAGVVFLCERDYPQVLDAAIDAGLPVLGVHSFAAPDLAPDGTPRRCGETTGEVPPFLAPAALVSGPAPEPPAELPDGVVQAWQGYAAAQSDRWRSQATEAADRLERERCERIATWWRQALVDPMHPAPAPEPAPSIYRGVVPRLSVDYAAYLRTVSTDELEHARATMAQDRLLGADVQEYRRLIDVEFRARGAGSCLNILDPVDPCTVPVLSGYYCQPCKMDGRAVTVTAEIFAATLEDFLAAVPAQLAASTRVRLDPDTDIDSLPDDYGAGHEVPQPGCCEDCDEILGLVAVSDA